MAEAAGVSKQEVSNRVILLLDDLLYDTSDIWGLALRDCLDKDTPFLEVVKIIQAAGVDNVTSKVVEAFLGLVVIGPGDCPVCGGKLEYHGDYKTCGGDGYLTPFDYEPTSDERTCNICGYTN